MAFTAKLKFTIAFTHHYGVGPVWSAKNVHILSRKMTVLYNLTFEYESCCEKEVHFSILEY